MLNYIVERKSNLLGTLLATLVFYVVFLPFNEQVAFVQPYVSHQAEIVAATLKFCGFPIFFSLFYFVISFVRLIRVGSTFHRTWFKYAAIYFGIMTVFFILLYPGHFVGDEFDVLIAVRNYSLFSWQNYLTNIFYTYSLYLIPTAVGIVVIQLGVLSFVTGYVIAVARKLFKKSYTHYFLFLPFLFFPVILNNLYPLRLTMFSYLLLLLVSWLLFIHKKIITPKNPKVFFLQASAILAVVAFWRSEGLIYLLFLPVFAYTLGLLSKSALRNTATYVAFVGALIFIGISYWITSGTANDQYQITATINPLSTMVQGNLKGKHINQDLAAINKVVDLSIVKKYPSYDEIPSFWNGAVRPDYSKHLKGYNFHIYRMFLENFNLFLANRIRVFLDTNSFDKYPSIGDREYSYDVSQFYNPDPREIQKINNFYATNKFSHPISLRLKLAITRRLELVNSAFRPGLLTQIVWSIIPTLILLSVLTIVALLRRWRLTVFLTALLLLHGLIIFLTAPGDYSMYYFPIYLVGNFILVLSILAFAEKRPALYAPVEHLFKRLSIVRKIKSKRPLVL